MRMIYSVWYYKDKIELSKLCQYIDRIIAFFVEFEKNLELRKNVAFIMILIVFFNKYLTITHLMLRNCYMLLLKLFICLTL